MNTQTDAQILDELMGWLRDEQRRRETAPCYTDCELFRNECAQSTLEDVIDKIHNLRWDG